MDGWMDGCVDEWMDGWMRDGCTDGWMKIQANVAGSKGANVNLDTINSAELDILGKFTLEVRPFK